MVYRKCECEKVAVVKYDFVDCNASLEVVH
nr:MAG TPA: hypothetical protein [Caudoviricetes sp.]